MTKTTDQAKASRANGRPARSEREAESREAIKGRFLDAAERLLIDEGYAAITTRRVAVEAGANHGLIHYYFGSMDELLARVLERFTERLVERQRAMYSADVPFREKWETAWRFQEEDLEAGYPKIWLELQAASWNRSDLRDRVARVNAEWRTVLTEAFSNAAREYGLDRRQFPVEALVSLMMTFGQGYALERLVGIDEGHRALLAWIGKWLKNLEGGAK
jgi:TetR/AcrR family transcriptional regulator